MLLKLVIILAIVIAGGMIFYNEISSIFPNTSKTLVDSVVSDMAGIGDRASDTITERVGESIGTAVDKSGDIITDGLVRAGDAIVDLDPLESGQEAAPPSQP